MSPAEECSTDLPLPLPRATISSDLLLDDDEHSSLSAVELNARGAAQPFVVDKMALDANANANAAAKGRHDHPLGLGPGRSVNFGPHVDVRYESSVEQSEHEQSHGKQNFALGVALVILMALLSGVRCVGFFVLFLFLFLSGHLVLTKKK